MSGSLATASVYGCPDLWINSISSCVAAGIVIRSPGDFADADLSNVTGFPDRETDLKPPPGTGTTVTNTGHFSKILGLIRYSMKPDFVRSKNYNASIALSANVMNGDGLFAVPSMLNSIRASFSDVSVSKFGVAFVSAILVATNPPVAVASNSIP